MKRLYQLLTVSALALSLSACATAPATIGTATSQTSAVITAIQQAAVEACSFLPTAATVTNIIGAATGVGAETTLASTIAAQICAAVSPTASAKRGGAAPTVYGVVVHGRFVSGGKRH